MALSRTNEESADVCISFTNLYDEINSIETQVSTSATNGGSVPTVKVSISDHHAQIAQVSLQVHRVITNVARLEQNVFIFVLPLVIQQQ
jgi:hypothetical protein